MAVYTPLTESDITEFLARYDVGELQSFGGIAEGVENTNYWVETREGKFILTLFERRTKLEDLPYFLALMEWFAARGIKCPKPVHMKDGRMLGALKEKPAAMVMFLEGGGADPVKNDHLPLLGDLAARMHIAGMDFPHKRPNALSVAGWEMIIDKIIDRVDEIEPGLRQFINEEFNFLSENWPDNLPSGAVHADLFPDNVFFMKSPLRLTGVIDFYFACHDAWAYDLAIIVNAWCFDARHRFQPERVQALMQSYNDVRPMTPEEEAVFPLLLRGAALRFLLTRAHDALFKQEGVVTHKDPLEYARKLEFFRDWKGA